MDEKMIDFNFKVLCVEWPRAAAAIASCVTLPPAMMLDLKFTNYYNYYSSVINTMYILHWQWSAWQWSSGLCMRGRGMLGASGSCRRPRQGTDSGSFEWPHRHRVFHCKLENNDASAYYYYYWTWTAVRVLRRSTQQSIEWLKKCFYFVKI